MSPNRPIRVLIVDDSALVRKMLTAALSADKQIEVVGTASDAYAARDKILALSPDVVTLDIEMPRMDGITFLKKLMHFRPLPVIVISSLGHAACKASVEALQAGAVEVLCKPDGPTSVGGLALTLAETIRSAATAQVRSNGRLPGSSAATPNVHASAESQSAPALYKTDGIIAIGASTGGPAAVAELLATLPRNLPPVVVVQHMPAVFTQHFANRLNQECAMEVKEAVDGDELLPGRVLIAPGNFHMTVCRSKGPLAVRIAQGPPVCFSRPSVDVLFSSVAAVAKAKAVGILLTGMGGDGARGMLELHKQGAPTIAQNEDTCVVFGMPKEAIRLNAAGEILPLNAIGPALLKHLKRA
jgi:two-component system chemotaxis response regulator CheB